MTKKRLQSEVEALVSETAKLQTTYQDTLQRLSRLSQAYDNSRSFDPIRRYSMLKVMVKEAADIK